MAHPSDKPDAETLPNPQLNPLLNPLLGAHMGRWAEVYFTSPPEKREQAVHDLLRELGGDAPDPRTAVTLADREIEDKRHSHREEETLENYDEVRESKVQEMHETPSNSLAEPTAVCHSCGHENLAGQKFCGMCGAPLQAGLENSPALDPPSEYHASQEPEEFQELEPADVREAAWSEAAAVTDQEETVSEPPILAEFAREEDPQSVWAVRETGLPSFAVEPESVPYRYRLYVGLVLAVLLVVLVYMAWRGTAALSGGAQPVPSKTIPSAPPASPAVASAPAQPQPPQPRTEEKAVAPKTTHAAPPPVENKPRVSARTTPTAARPPIHASPSRVAPVATPAASQPSGAEELATAEKYLNGSLGNGGNKGEAAQWLWKAVAKGNLTATMTLSDLYLRGDGVPKSCDQARLLLDAAARKGAKGAGERLRNLPSFGCQ